MKTIVIIGGGFSGTLTAIQLLEKSKTVQIKVINTEHPVAKGIAYGTLSSEHLLNVMAGRMSPFPNDADHFINWLRAKNYPLSNLETAFLPRMVYGEYLEELLSKHRTNKQLELIDAKAVDIQKKENKYSVLLNNGNSVIADKIVLAMGNFLPANPKIKDPEFFKSKNYFQNPWEMSCIKEMPPDKAVLILGTGLTMVDCVLSLKKQGFKGKIYVVSPRGYIPVSHIKHYVYPDFYEELKDKSLLEILRSVRKHLKDAASKNIPWQTVIDSIRTHIQKIWIGLPKKEKQQFISHLRHIWGLARHRVPEEAYTQFMDLKEKGQIEVIGGRIIEMQEKNSTITASIQLRRSKTKRDLVVSRVINCTGPQLNFSEIKDELVQNLLSKKVILADELRMGLQSTPTGQVIQKDNTVSPDIYAIGSLLRGVLWETTAVPDISVEAECIARQIIKSIE